MTSSESGNIFIDSLWLKNPVVRVTESNSLSTVLVNTGKEDRKILLRLFIDEQQISTQEVLIAPASKSTATLDFTITSTGYKTGRIEFDDNPTVFDNHFYFTLNCSPKIKILHLHQNASGFIEKVYANNSFFECVHSAANEYSYANLFNFDLIILENLEKLSESTLAQIRKFSENGGSVVLIPNQNFEGIDFSKTMGIDEFKKINPDTINIDFKTNYTFQSPIFKQAFFKNIFEKEQANMSMPFAIPSHYAPKGGEVLLKFKNDDTYLSLYQKKGLGKSYLFASSLNHTKTNFPKHSLFVAIMYKIAFESKSNFEQLYFGFQSPNVSIDIPHNPYQTKTVFKLIKDSISIIPQQKKVGNKLYFSIPNIGVDAGNFNLQVSDSITVPIAFNHSKIESYNQSYSIEEIKTWVAKHQNISMYESSPNKSFVSEFSSDAIGIALWKYFVILSIVFLVIEILLLRFYK
jgi:hypothetical protein